MRAFSITVVMALLLAAVPPEPVAVAGPGPVGASPPLQEPAGSLWGPIGAAAPSGLGRPGDDTAVDVPRPRGVDVAALASSMSRPVVQADGTVRLEVFSRPVLRRGEGGWVAVDHAIAEGEGPWPLAVPGALRPVSFGSGADALVALELDAGPVTLAAPGLEAGRPVLDGDVVRHEGVARDADLEYRVDVAGLHVRLVRHSPEAPRTVRLRLADPAGQLEGVERRRGGGYAFGGVLEGRVGLGVRAGGGASVSVTRSGDGYDVALAVADTAGAEGDASPVMTLEWSGVALPEMDADGCYSMCSWRRTSYALVVDDYLRVGTWSGYEAFYFAKLAAFLKFDLSMIDPGTPVIDASFHMTLVGQDGRYPNEDRDVALRPLAEPMDYAASAFDLFHETRNPSRRCSRLGRTTRPAGT